VRALAVAAGRLLVASAGRDNTVRLCAAETLKPIHTFPVEDPKDICFSGDEKNVVVATARGIEVWDLITAGRRLSWPIDDLVSPIWRTKAIRVFRNVLYVAAGNQTLSAWDLTDGRKLWQLGKPERRPHAPCSIDVNFNGRLLLTCVSSEYYGPALTLWDAETGARLRDFDQDTVNRHQPETTCFVPNGRFALTGGGDGTVRVWDVATGECVRAMEGHKGAVRGVGVLLSGAAAYSWGDDPRLICWALDWELEARRPVDWDESAATIAAAYLDRAGGSWAEPQSVQELVLDLNEAGFGVLRGERTLAELGRQAMERGLR
jgi:hypothetical protein